MRCRKCAPVPEEVRRAADLLERRYSLSIVYACHAGASRFNEFRQALGPCRPARSRRGWSSSRRPACSSARVIDARPPRVEYLLTERGQMLETLIAALEHWAAAGA